jgi:hypothetical protein
MDQLQYMADKGAFIEYTLAAYTHTTTIPKTHYYVEREYASIDEGMSGADEGGIKQVAGQIQELGAEHCARALYSHALENEASRNVARKLGMVWYGVDFKFT